MVNTNGRRIARDPAFAERLATYMPGCEVYLQLDSLREGPLRTLRGADLRRVTEQALARLESLGISTTLVVTLKRGVNDDELGELVRFALGWRCVRGVTFQPVQDAGRNEGPSAPRRRTLTEVRRRLLEQCELFTPADVVPVPCHPDSLAMAYALKGEGAHESAVAPLTRYVPPEVLLAGPRSTLSVEKDPALQKAVGEALARAFTGSFSTAHGPESAACSLKELLCCLPRIEALPELSYERVFRVVITAFLDRHSMDLRSVRKTCVHIAHPDGRRVIPFDTYNVLYRDGLEETRLAPLRRGEGAPSRLVTIGRR